MISALGEPWLTVLGRFSGQSRCLAVGLFAADGACLYANPAMVELLWPQDQEIQGLVRFMTPTFDELAAASRSLPPGGESVDPHLLRTGWIQVGSLSEFGRSVMGQIWLWTEQILVVAEYDVPQLLAVEQEITLLNGRLSSLQRELTVKNQKLERTLAELQETQAMLIHSEKMNALGQLVAGVAHEINNPVAFVASNLHGMQAAVTDLLTAFGEMESLAVGRPEGGQAVARVRTAHQVDLAVEDIQEALASSVAGLARVKKLVQSLRTFSRLDEAEYKLADLRECLESTLAVLKSELRNQIQITLDLPPLPPVPCYAAQLSQVFMNILLNGIQAIHGPGAIVVAAHESAQEIILTFTDSGPGIPPEVLPKVFNPFFTTKPVGSGTGLGLYIAYKIITEQHKGRIEATSTVGQGATFTVALPKEPLP